MSILGFVGMSVLGLAIGFIIGSAIGYRGERRLWATRNSGWVHVSAGAAQNALAALLERGDYPETVKHITAALKRHWRESLIYDATDVPPV